MEQAFIDCKATLANATIFTPQCPLTHTSDASDISVGAVLEQLNQDHWECLAIFSCQLRTPKQLMYCAFDREFLAVHLAIRDFGFIVEERQFTIFTDHKPLVHAVSKATELWSV